MKLFKHFTVIILFIAFSGCQKDNYTPQPNKVKINISSLYDGQYIHNRDTVWLEGKISYISNLHGYSIVLKNKEQNKELFAYYEHTHNNEVSFKKYWINTLTDSTNLLLLITGEIDHDGNNGIKELNLVSQP